MGAKLINHPRSKIKRPIQYAGPVGITKKSTPQTRRIIENVSEFCKTEITKKLKIQRIVLNFQL